MASSAHSVFSRIYRDHLWGSSSKSGLGSTPEYTVYVVPGIRRILHRFGPFTILDLPCGDGDWVRSVFDDYSHHYIGADVVPDIIADNSVKYPDLDWRVLDLCSDPLPAVDMVLCRDCLVHFPLTLIHEALRNFKKSGSKILATTTFPRIPEGNTDIEIGQWRRIDLQAPPFNLPPPALMVNECGPGQSQTGDKSLGVWHLQDLNL